MMVKQDIQQQRATMNRERGQILIIAVLMMGVLLVIGLTFSAILGQNIRQTADSRRRDLAADMARAGVEYAHYQLQFSSLGADWRPVVTPPQDIDPQGFTKDPDAIYLRPGSGLVYPSPSGNIVDLGGPDGMGPYTRIFFERGRSLVRVRYASQAYDAFADPTGSLRTPGKARRYITIETVGRPGQLLAGSRIDPSLLLDQSVKVENYVDANELQQELGTMRQMDNLIYNSRRMIGFASLGITEQAHFITNKHNVSRAAEIGFPLGSGGAPIRGSDIGVTYEGSPVQSVRRFGLAFAEPNSGVANSWQSVPGGGSLHSNADLVVYGVNEIILNSFLGESWNVAGRIKPGGNASGLAISRVFYNTAADQWQSSVAANQFRNYPGGFPSTINNPIPVSGPQLDSDSPIFATLGYILRDGRRSQDIDGYSRGISRKEPPSIMADDPQGGGNRYREQTRNSGQVVGGRNIGVFGYGRGIYVDSDERGNTDSEDEREQLGSVRSLPNDWLNPNNPSSLAWQGPYYRPIAAYLQLLPDGFLITRDSRSDRPFWRNVNGANSGQSTVRYRIRRIGDRTYILNSILHPGLVGLPAGSLADTEFLNNGAEFNGLVYFEGDVAVRGVIPTDHQISVISMGTIYINGSITKGLVTEAGAVLNRASQSLIALMARDYITINTTQFFAPGPGQDPKPKNADPLADTPNPFELNFSDAEEITLQAQLLLNPNSPGGNVANPATWSPYVTQYSAANGGGALNTNVLMKVSADDDGPSGLSMDVVPLTHADGSPTGFRSYLFKRLLDFGAAGVIEYNSASPAYAPGFGPNIPVYGLGDPAVNAYPKFEVIAQAIVDRNTGAFLPYSVADRKLLSDATNPEGQYELAMQDETAMRLRLNYAGTAVPKNFLVAQTAMAPHNIRIEAALFAEEGSFFVIPGPWFNNNNEDTRDNFENAVGIYNGIPGFEQRQRRRFEVFGHSPEVPFYAEPLMIQVEIYGSLSENMPAPISQQAEWLQKWGWLPRRLGATGVLLPEQFIPAGYDVNTDLTVPNLLLRYDPALGTGTTDGTTPLRVDDFGRMLPPLPRLPVSSTLAYFGEVR